jgi:hypothetical protein
MCFLSGRKVKSEVVLRYEDVWNLQFLQSIIWFLAIEYQNAWSYASIRPYGFMA